MSAPSIAIGVPVIVPARGASGVLLAVGSLVAGKAGCTFAMPAHALCVVTGVLAGAMEVETTDELVVGMDGGGRTWRPLPAWSIQGPQTRARRWRAAPGTRVVSMLLRAHVLAERLGQPAALYRDRWITSDALTGLLQVAPGDDAGGTSRGARRDRLQRDRVMAAVATTHSVPDAARFLGLGERRLQRLCDRELGLPPVVLARLMRMHRCAATAAQRGRLDAEAALASGYADQAHMARDFRLLGGIRPRDLTAEHGWPMRESGARVLPAWRDDLSDSSKT